MALLAYDGFDNYASGTADILNRRAGGLQWSTGDITGYVSPGRNNAGSAVSLGQNTRLLGTLSNALASGYFGFGIKITLSGVSLDTNPSLAVMDLHSGVANAPDVVQLSLVFNVFTCGIDVYRGDGSATTVPVANTLVLLGSTPNNTLTMDAWNYVEVFTTISNSAGVVTIRVNGQQVLALSGIDTQANAHSYFEGLWFSGGPAPTSTLMQIDDFYVADTTTGAGAFPFDFFAGDVRVITLYPVGNVGTPGWTPLASTNWVEVSETHSDGDSSYNATSTVGAQDMFNFQTLGATITSILAVQVNGCYRKDDAGTRTLAQHLSSGGTEVAGTTQSIPANYVYLADFYTLDPHTSAAWTVSAVNALQAGYVLVS